MRNERQKRKVFLCQHVIQRAYLHADQTHVKITVHALSSMKQVFSVTVPTATVGPYAKAIRATLFPMISVRMEADVKCTLEQQYAIVTGHHYILERIVMCHHATQIHAFTMAFALWMIVD